MDQNTQAATENDYLNIFVEKLENRRTRLFVFSPSLLISLLWVMFIFLPIVRVMFIYPIDISVMDLDEYHIEKFFPILYSGLILLTGYGSLFGFSLIKKGKAKAAIALSIIAGILAFVFLILFSLECEDIAASLEDITVIRVNTGSAVTVMEIAGILSAVYNIAFAVIIGQLKSGKIKLNK